ncbi:sulfotransferase domain-containing protein [Parvibaculum sedimenti]|uniref:Sulfotransferase domain-containing protein n=1 Tax=Parvibaculum sedimenti TaxID=2608632 RepID=A0A6N6VI36_9HYPH|nr:sulfotransferase domain-containing protein [Parvibaculum sedimenti]KAB7738511.1 sulfotransferase domain-containing protein [Parvibaculum sedimenti]
MGALIWLASYPKSGNTWMRSFLHNLLRNPPKPVPLNELDEFCLGESASEWYRRRSAKPLEELTPIELAALRPLVHRDFTNAFPDSVFVKTHNFLGEWLGHPLHNMEVTAGAIYIVRNPLDVVLSMAPHFGLSIDEAIEALANEAASTALMANHVPEIHSSWSTHVRSWTQHPNPQLLVLRYEDMLDKPRRSFKQVVEFLGVKPTSERLERAIRFSSFKMLKAQEQREGFKERSSKAAAFFREGRKDQWREKLTPEQVRRVVSVHYEQMARFGYIPNDYLDAMPDEARRTLAQPD